MTIKGKDDFINAINIYDIRTECIVIKPNWVSNVFGESTESEILEWLLKALPSESKKIIIESYTPWRGMKFTEDDDHRGIGVTLKGGKRQWDFYLKQDKLFLKETGNDIVLKKFNSEYLNITNEIWSDRAVDAEVIKEIVENKGKTVKWEELYGYIPNKLFDIRDKSTLISLSKIKTEEGIPDIGISMSIKNLFGLIPHPSRWIPFHGKNHETVPEVIKDIYTIYTCLFEDRLWISEGIKTLIRNYCEPNQRVVRDMNLLFVGKDGIEVDTQACLAMAIDPKKIKYLCY